MLLVWSNVTGTSLHSLQIAHLPLRSARAAALHHVYQYDGAFSANKRCHAVHTSRDVGDRLQIIALLAAAVSVLSQIQQRITHPASVCILPAR